MDELRHGLRSKYQTDARSSNLIDNTEVFVYGRVRQVRGHSWVKKRFVLLRERVWPPDVVSSFAKTYGIVVFAKESVCAQEENKVFISKSLTQRHLCHSNDFSSPWKRTSNCTASSRGHIVCLFRVGGVWWYPIKDKHVCTRRILPVPPCSPRILTASSLKVWREKMVCFALCVYWMNLIGMSSW